MSTVTVDAFVRLSGAAAVLVGAIISRACYCFVAHPNDVVDLPACRALHCPRHKGMDGIAD